MTSPNLSLSSNDDEIALDITSPTSRLQKEQLKSKFRLAAIDDIEKKSRYEIKEKADEIKRLLCMRVGRYTVNASGVTKSHLASWWSTFGFAKEEVSGETYFVSNFVSCQKCFTTYRYGSSSTESISRHQCNSSISSSPKSATIDNQFTLDKHFIKEKKIFRHFEKQNATKLFCNWVSDSFRPISMIEDQGFYEICSYFYDLGTKNYNRNMDVQSLFQSRQTVSRCIVDQAQYYRQQLSDIIREPLDNHCVTLSPDMWSDKFRQLSYLGVTATFIDINMKFKKFTLCCRSFPVELRKTGENISKVLKEEFDKYKIDRFDSVYWVSDRGSNFIRCFNLNMVEPILCFAHRMHNVLTITFMNKKIDDYFNDEDIEDIPDNIDQEEYLGDESMSLAVKRILLTIKYTKNLVKYVKMSNLNELIVKLGGEGTTTLKQSVVTRWLSLFTCVESVYLNYDATLLALEHRRATKYLNELSKNNLIDLLLLLTPLHVALQSIQIDMAPSLHLVVPFYQKLLNDYGSYSKLVASAKKKKPSLFQNSFVSDHLLTESSGVQFFRERIYEKLLELFVFDDRHYIAMCLHPAMREMDGIPYHTKTGCYNNIRQYLQDEEVGIINTPTTTDTLSTNKRRKLLHKFLEEDEDEDAHEAEQTQTQILDSNIDIVDDDNLLVHKSSIRRSHSNSSLSTEFSYRTNYRTLKPDELDLYLETDIPSTIVKENPIDFWSSEFASRFPRLKNFARKILSIPATSSGTERLFSYSGIILNSRRQRLSPDQVDNMLVIRSARQILSNIKQVD
ncbi:unnamed protein product [Adineta steineri]|uniref:HAT C-terminal dimerisation domain-containing protein n=1 Tax=Adineta steineri TaxID=433720 RepID=A0A814KCF4_9BILA|nr:unnamed protein product [Adineta steineri]CAF1081887.1 unnamed protein product [Adineta steineri]